MILLQPDVVTMGTPCEEQHARDIQALLDQTLDQP